MQDTTTEGAANPDAQQHAGFWRRLIAFAIDGFLLGAVGWLLAWGFYDTLAQLGVLGRVVGFAIALAYFGILNSRIGGGQTLGKRMLGLRAQRLDGTLLSVPQSFARYSVLGIPFFLNNAPLPIEVLMGPGAYLLALVVFGGMGSIAYLFLFNRETRRSLHDYAVGSWVARTSARGFALPPTRLWRGHVVAVGCLLAATLALPVVANRLASSMPVFEDLLAAQDAMTPDQRVLHARISAGFTQSTKAPETTWVAIQAQLTDPDIADNTLAERLARSALAAAPRLKERDVVVVTLAYGFDLGIATGWRANQFKFDPGTIAASKAAAK